MIMTVMNRMVEKKILLRRREKHQFFYWRNHQVDSSQASLLDKLRQKLFAGRSALMASYLIESCEEITEQELVEMEKLIQLKIQKTNKNHD
jgi:predicted transcriptional regulator